jgi:hypothetical protein
LCCLPPECEPALLAQNLGVKLSLEEIARNRVV